MKLRSALLALLLVFPLAAQEGLTNDSVIKMVQGGLAPDQIVKAIAEAPSVAFNFVYLDYLTKAGVSDDVIRAMGARAAGRPIPGYKPVVRETPTVAPTVAAPPAPTPDATASPATGPSATPAVTAPVGEAPAAEAPVASTPPAPTPSPSPSKTRGPKPATQDYAASCSAVWTASKTVVHGYYDVLSLNDGTQTGSFTTGSVWTGIRSLAFSLAGSGDRCTVSVTGHFSGLIHDDKGDFFKRIQMETHTAKLNPRGW